MTPEELAALPPDTWLIGQAGRFGVRPFVLARFLDYLPPAETADVSIWDATIDAWVHTKAPIGRLLFTVPAPPSPKED